MTKKACQSLFLACVLLFPAARAIAATFPLPDDAVIDIRQFTLPESARSDSERNLPEALRLQIINALQQAGISVWIGRGSAPAAAESASSSVMKTTKLAATPEPDSDGTASREFDAPLDADTADPPPDILAPPEENPDSAPGEMVEETPPIAAMPEPGAAPPTHILVGNVTLFRETVAAPTRIAGTIRVRAETSLHCVYKIIDAATGKVIISDAASGSSARVTAQTQDIDAILAFQTVRALALTATNLANALSGNNVEKDAAQGREYYQDSPGKRLKPKQ